MRILPVTFYNLQASKNADFERNHYNLSVCKELPFDTFAFTAKPMSGKEFKKTCTRFMTCFYTGDKLMDSKDLAKMKKRGFFRGSIKDFVKKTKPYAKNYIEPNTVESAIYQKIVVAAKLTPDITLPELFQSWYKSARSNFRKEQKPHFDVIKTLGAQLPQSHIEKFFKYMEKIDRKLYDEPVRQEFSLKEFKYKISKSIEKSTDIPLKNRIKYFLEILSDPSFSSNDPIPAQIIKKVFDFKNVDVPYKKSKYYNRYLQPLENDKVAVKLRIIELMKETLAAKGYKKLEKVCDDNLDMLLGNPVRIPFSNKTFIYDLNEVLEDLPDEALRNEIMLTAQKLPSSAHNVDAMILKLHDTDADMIGDRLFNPWLASIEHFHPDSLGGADDMVNCGLAKRWINTLRGNEDLWAFIKRMGFAPKHQYKYAENIVKVNHKHKVPYDDALGHLETIECEAKMDLQKYKDRLVHFEPVTKSSNL